MVVKYGWLSWGYTANEALQQGTRFLWWNNVKRPVDIMRDVLPPVSKHIDALTVVSRQKDGPVIRVRVKEYEHELVISHNMFVTTLKQTA